MSDTPQSAPASSTQRLVLTKAKECKHSVVYEAPGDDKTAFVSSVYLMRRAISGPMPQQITLTLEVNS